MSHYPVTPIPRTVLRAVAAGLVLLGLAACSSGPAGKKIAGHQPPVQGGYKVGIPYQIQGKWYYPKENFKYDRKGIASWYGHPFHGRKTANGEKYDMWARTAAHKTLPMPSLVEVTNLDNGRKMVLRLNDRGPFVDGRIIDVSRKAARELGFERAGVANVRVRVLEKESRRMKQLAIANQNGRARAVAARRQGVAPVNVAAKPAGAANGARPTPKRTDIVVRELKPAPNGAAPQGRYPPAGGQTAGATGGKKTPAWLRPPDTPAKTATTRPQPRIKASLVRSTPATKPRPVPTVTTGGGRIFVQAGAFREHGNATRLGRDLSRFGNVAIVPVQVNGQQLYRVRVGPVADSAQGNRLLAQVVDAGYPRARIITD